VLVAGFPAGAFAANCYIVAPAPGEECVIIDPGQDAQPGIEEVLAEHRLRPAAVLLTHGHIDHVWSVAPVCRAKGIPAYIHPDDRALLSDPAKGFPLGAGQQLFGGLEFTEPDDVKELADGMTLSLVGLEIVVNHAPGHTEGSVAFRMPLDPPNSAQGQSKTGAAETPGAAEGQSAAEAPHAPASDPGGILFSGDLLFAGSIGRTDLPGGDYPTILRSLARVCLTLADETVVLSGHGPQTTIGAERRTNPFLTDLTPESGPRQGL
jgi:glyoxylase-like metal-dependent hydrolase (beta-lactamase superfamily II)